MYETSPVYARPLVAFLLLPVLLMTWGACSAEPLEEVVSSAPNLCGPWALPHRASYGCEYPVMRQSNEHIIRALRPELFERCLSCRQDTCRIRDLAVEDRTTCEVVFATPERIISFAPDIVFSDRTFDARFTYAIDSGGRITQVKLIETRGMPSAQVQNLIQAGANQLRYLPLQHNGRTYRIEALSGAYVMQVRQ